MKFIFLHSVLLVASYFVTTPCLAGPSQTQNVSLQTSNSSISKIAFSPDQKIYATASLLEGEVKLWDFSTKRLIHTWRASTKAIKPDQVSSGIESFNNYVNDISFSNNGRLIAIGTGDGTYVLDTETQKEIAKLDSGKTVAVSFLDEKKLLAAGKTLSLWSVETKAVIKEYSNDDISGMTVSNDKQYIALVRRSALWGFTYKLEIINTLSGKSISKSSVGNDVYASLLIAFSSDSKHIALASRNSNIIEIRTVESGRTFSTLKGKRDGGIGAIAFSPKGQYLLTGATILTIEKDGEYIHSTASGGQLTLWDWQAGLPINHFGSTENSHQAVTFSPDGTKVAADTLYSVSFYDLSVLLASTSTSAELSKPDEKISIQNAQNTATSVDTKTSSAKPNAAEKIGELVGNIFGFLKNNDQRATPRETINDASKNESDIQPLNAEGSQTPESSGANYANLSNIKVLNNGTIAATNANSHQVRLLDIKTGKEDGIIVSKKIFEIRNLVFNEKLNQLIILGLAHKPSSDYILEIYDIKSNKLINSTSLGENFKNSTWIPSASISSDGKLLAYTMYDHMNEISNKNKIVLFDTLTQKHYKTIKTQGSLVGVEFIPNSHTLLYKSDQEYVRGKVTAEAGVFLLNVDTEKLIWKQPQNFSSIELSSSLKPSSDGKKIAMLDNDYLKIIEVESGRITNEVKLPAIDKRVISPSHVNFSSSNDAVVITYDNQTIFGVNIESSSLMWQLPLTDGGIKDISYFDTTSKLTLISTDGTLRIINVPDNNLVSTFAFFNDDSYLILTPEGYFSASSVTAAKNLNVHKNNQVYNIDQFYDAFYRPDIVYRKLSRSDISSLINTTIDQAALSTPPAILKLDVPPSNADQTIKISYHVKSTGGGIGDLRIFHNGKLVKSDGRYRADTADSFGKKSSQLNEELITRQLRGAAQKAASNNTLRGAVVSKSKSNDYKGEFKIQPISGENEISITAFNGENTIQSKPVSVTFTSTKPKFPPNLFILAIGVDEYKDKSSNLKYAVKDSQDIIKRWGMQATQLYGAKHVKIETLKNAQASRAAILKKIKQLALTIGPNDHFILFIASHGTLLAEQYYMVTSDYDGNLKPTTMISANEFVDFSKEIKALSQLYILDTCHAGGMGGVISGLYDARISVLAKQMGLHIYASASSAEEAIDGYEGNGLFTHTLLNGLDNNKMLDANSDLFISVSELGNYSKKQTKEIALTLKHQQDPLIINLGKDSEIYKLQ